MTRPPHHRDGGFQNNHGDFQPKSLADLLRWRWNAARRGLPPPPQAPIPTVPADLDFIHANAGGMVAPAVTWIGHATVLAQFGGLNLLTDPIFSERASPLPFAGPKREQAPGVALAALPRIDAVLVSHNHYDHLDLPSCRALARQGPLGLAAWCRARGIQHVVELDWWEGHALAGVDIVLVPARHWSARGLNDRMKTLWGGFAVFAPDCQLFFAGDTGYSRDFADIRTRFAERQRDGGFDLALLPIGAWAPRWFMRDQHVDVEEALKIHADLGARRSLGVHWGTFALSDEALDEPPRQLALQRAAAGMAESVFFTLAIGQTQRLPRR
jgi:N-acyl-phosphatidylethanolamine-hydrolysing phospholipase D